MKAKVITFLLVAVLLVVAVWLLRKKENTPGPDGSPARKSTPRESTARRSDNDTRGFRRMISYIEYTVHAKCQMKCRHVTQEEIKDIMQNGRVNYTKSDLNDRPCPTYALEGYTQKDNQHVRIIFAQCSQKTKVVTCIDLDEENDCDCR